MNSPALERSSQLQVVSDLAALDDVLAWFDQLCLPTMQGPVWSRFWVQCKTILAEGFTNAVRHAHRGYPHETIVIIVVTLRSQSLEMCIWDSGAPFDLRKKLAELQMCHDLYADGGRGLMIMDSLTDEMAYDCYPNGRNCLRVSKAYPIGATY
ncbi:ATP-binding protein [Trichothermofontia sp.]